MINYKIVISRIYYNITYLYAQTTRLPFSLSLSSFFLSDFGFINRPIAIFNAAIFE